MASYASKIDSVTLATYVLAKRGPMPHLKLQKLIYYIEAWHLAIIEQPLISDNFQAWPHGPVCRKLWDRFKDPSSPVMGEVKVDALQGRAAKMTVRGKLSRSQVELIDDVLCEYGDKSAYHLECLTHAEQPWQAARVGLSPADKSSNVISKDLMKSFYRSRLKT